MRRVSTMARRAGTPTSVARILQLERWSVVDASLLGLLLVVLVLIVPLVGAT